VAKPPFSSIRISGMMNHLQHDNEEPLVLRTQEPLLAARGDALPALIADAERAAAQRRMHFRLTMAVAGLGGFILFGLPWLLPLLGIPGNAFSQVTSWMLIGVWVAALAFVFLGMRREEAGFARLAGIDDVSVVGPLINALESSQNNPAAASVLPRLLPRLTAHDAGLLTSVHREVLHTVLMRRGGEAQEALQHAILDALPRIGDAQSLTTVARLAEGEGAGQDPVFRSRAAELLPAMKARVDHLHAQKMLIRPSAAPEAAEDQLLRPAGAGETAAEALLRPSDPPRVNRPVNN
jgi:hypothetical protein